MKIKTFLLKFAIAICFALTASNTFAYDFEVDGIYYNVTSLENLEVEVTRCYTAEYVGDVIIPETVVYKNRELRVTSIKDNAFEGCSGLTSVDIGDGVTSIGDDAFRTCSGLTSIDIPDGVTSIGEYAFCYCSGLTSVDIPNSVTSIGDGAFEGCSGLTSVDIPDGVTSIGNGAFRDCSGLTSVDIPNSVTSIGRNAFYGCSGLTSVDIGDGVTSIGDNAFSGCRGLTSVDIPDGVTSIGEYAFSSCSGLTSVDIPDGVTSIGEAAFSYCDTIEEFIFPAGTQDYPINKYSSIGLFGIYGGSDNKYSGTIVNKLHIADSPNALKLSYIYYYRDYYYDNYHYYYNYYYYYEPYYLGLKELYIGRKLDIDSNSKDYSYVLPGTLEKVEIGGCLKSDGICRYRDSYYFRGSIKDLVRSNIRTIIYGDSIAEITDPVTTASEIYLRCTTPPVTAEWENSNYINSILYVPQGTLTVYQNADVWKNFWDIREWDSTTTDIKSPTIDNTDAADVSIDGKQVTVTTNNPGTRVQIYNTDGVLVYDGKEGTVNIGTPGLYIIKAGNLTKKLLVK